MVALCALSAGISRRSGVAVLSTSLSRDRNSCGAGEFTGQRAANQICGLRAAEERRERAEARPLALPEYDFVERFEPTPQRLESVRLADLVDNVLYRLAVANLTQPVETRRKIKERRPLLLA